MAFLDKATFTTIIDSTPLVSIDLVVENEQGRILLGKRNNKPAQGFWFVPGGRILKNETMVDAFKRLTHQELGTSLSMNIASFIGPFEHFYKDCVFNDDITTHYVVLGYKLNVNEAYLNLPKTQHNEYKWFDKSELLASERVHRHSKWYFDHNAI